MQLFAYLFSIFIFVKQKKIFILVLFWIAFNILFRPSGHICLSLPSYYYRRGEQTHAIGWLNLGADWTLEDALKYAY
jgi:hypothetical protein